MKFNDPIDYYEAIAAELVSIVSESWVSITVNATRYEESINLEIFYVRPDGSEESDVDPIMLGTYFYELASVISTVDKGLYKTCHFHLKPDGNFDVNFEY
jgi:hypothetical protein